MDLNADEHAQDYDRNKAVCDLALASLIAAVSCSIRTMPPLGATEWDEWLQAWDEAAKKLHRRALALNPGVKVQRTYRLFLQVRGDAAEIQRICGADAADYLYQQASRLRNEALAACGSPPPTSICVRPPAWTWLHPWSRPNPLSSRMLRPSPPTSTTKSGSSPRTNGPSTVPGLRATCVGRHPGYAMKNHSTTRWNGDRVPGYTWPQPCWTPRPLR